MEALIMKTAAILLTGTVILYAYYRLFFKGKKNAHTAAPQGLTVKNIADYLKEHDNIYEMGDKKTEGKEIVCETLRMLKEMPDSDTLIRGSFYLRNYEKEESEVFYIPDMLLYFELLRDEYYFRFIHECSDFLHYKIQQDGKREIRYLPTDIKNALILTIEKGIAREA